MDRRYDRFYALSYVSSLNLQSGITKTHVTSKPSATARTDWQPLPSTCTGARMVMVVGWWMARDTKGARIQSSRRMRECDGGKRRGKEKERRIERGNSSRIIRGPKYRAPRTLVVLPSLPRLSSGSIKRFTPCKLSTTLQSLPLLCHISGINVSKYAIW